MKDYFKCQEQPTLMLNNSETKKIELVVDNAVVFSPQIFFKLTDVKHKVFIKFKSETWKEIYSLQKEIVQSLHKKPRQTTTSRPNLIEDIFIENENIKVHVQDLHKSRGLAFTSEGKTIRMMSKTFYLMMYCVTDIKTYLSNLSKEIQLEADRLYQLHNQCLNYPPFAHKQEELLKIAKKLEDLKNFNESI